MTLTLRKNQGSRAIKGGAGSDMGSIQSAHAWGGLEGTILARTRGPEQWPKVLAVKRGWQSENVSSTWTRKDERHQRFCRDSVACVGL